MFVTCERIGEGAFRFFGDETTDRVAVVFYGGEREAMPLGAVRRVWFCDFYRDDRDLVPVKRIGGELPRVWIESRAVRWVRGEE